jgi:hypothetical protein
MFWFNIIPLAWTFSILKNDAIKDCGERGSKIQTQTLKIEQKILITSFVTKYNSNFN